MLNAIDAAQMLLARSSRELLGKAASLSLILLGLSCSLKTRTVSQDERVLGNESILAELAQFSCPYD
jgi:hypothetical protein